MTTETLTGREIDVRVAKVLGWRWVMPQTTPGRAYLHPPEKVADWLPAFVSEVPPEGKQLCDNAMPAYSAPDCSGLAPVLAWLAENRPTREQAAAETACLRRGHWCRVHFEEQPDGWVACYMDAGGDMVSAVEGETLPAAACRLLVAWAAKREGGS
jgi:hypothetical protein